MKLNILFPDFDIADSAVVFSIENDSREVREGSLFIAYTGFQVDVHQYIPQAYTQGCRYFVVEYCQCERLQLQYPKALFIPSTNLKKESSQIALKFYDYPDKELILVGITGTNGKTTVATLVYQMLVKQGYKTSIFGTVEWKVDDQTYCSLNTTPDFLVLIKFLRQSVDVGVTHVVLEVASHALSLGRVEGLNFNCVAWTNLSQDHLDYHGTLESYFQAKTYLFLELFAHSEKTAKQSFINSDDEYGRRLLKLMSERKMMSESISLFGNGTWTARDVVLSLLNTTFTLTYQHQTVHVDTVLLGLINVQNVSMAYAIGSYLGCLPYTINEVLKNIVISGRLEKIFSPKEALFLVDFAHTPDALEKTMDVVNSIVSSPGRSIVVFGAGGDRDVTKRQKMARATVKADIVIVTSDNPRTEDPEKIIDHIMEGFDDHSNVYREVDRIKALTYAYKIAKKGDVILVAGKGHENYQIVGRTKTYFSDSEHIQNIIHMMH